ncbi:hypothetical protein [Arthrobacter sp. 7Tela_A1]|uniref:hypothetical protein n=1 Tax=Arthrobacter sp. 7Tela_A1 TaxID=3093745 RepID=UPI003BB6FD71
MGEIDGRDVVSTRISIFNLDPIEQSKLWLQLGPVEAKRVLVGVLRTALLFGGTVVVDRNQVLEGVFFVAMSPDRLAWHLGLEPGAPLPIEVQLLPGTAAAEVSPGPWRLADGRRSWGVDAELVSAIEANHAAVRDDPHRVSSPIIALTGGMYERAAVADPSAHSSSGGVKTEAWNISDPVVMPQILWNEQDREVARSLRETGRSAWTEAMLCGRVAVRDSKGLTPNPLGPELAAELPPNQAGLPVVDQLVKALVNLEYAQEAQRAATSKCLVEHPGDESPCDRAHATTRSLVTRWLDGEHVALLDPPRLPEPLRSGDLAVHRSAALGWWTQAYNRAICSRDKLRLLTIYNALPSPSGVLGDGAAAAELAWGLRRPPETIRSKLRGRRRRGRVPGATAASSTLPIGGDVVARLAGFTPAEYSRLQAFDAVGSAELLRNPGRRSLFDLVVAIDEIAGDTTSRSRRMRSTAVRGSIVTIGGLAVVLYENGFIALSGQVWAVIAFIAAALFSAPWSDLGTLRRMSGSQLQSTLRFQE